GLGGEAEAFAHEGEASAGGGAHGANTGVRGADGHIDDADLIFNLAHDDSGFAGVIGDPVEDAGGGTHRIGAVEFDAGGGASHGKGTVAAEDRVFVLRHGERPGEGFEVFGGVVVAGASYADVLVDDGLFFFAELLGDDAFESGKAYAHH